MRIVLIRLSALGDIVHTWPLAVAIRAALPRGHLTWIVEEPLAPLVEDHPAVDAVLTVATGRWRKQPFSSRTRAEIAAFRSRVHESPLFQGDENLVALVSDVVLDFDVPRFDPDDTKGLADFVQKTFLSK